MSGALSLGHVHLKVRDLDRAVEFYRAVAGLRVVERVPGYAFLTGDDAHHRLALQEVGPAAPLPGHRSVGLYHTAWEAPDRSALLRAVEAARAAGADPAGVDHGISVAFYFADPDGNGVELYLDTRAAEGGREAWAGESRPVAGA